MRFDILTLFPDMMRAVLEESILGRAAKKGILEFSFTNIRDFAENKHKKVDDYAYGGGTGLVMAPQPIVSAHESIPKAAQSLTIYLSPQGKVLTQELAKELAGYDQLILLCGHYEGVDERAIEEVADMEVSIGDYVLTGGEIPAMALIDCVARMVDGVLPNSEAYSRDSHYNGLLEYPQYTRPPMFRGRAVPEILLSGHHANIEKWQRKQALYRTWKKRPDMLRRADLDENDKKYLNLYKGKKRKKGGFLDG